MFDAVFDRNLFKIPDISHLAHITCNYWHQALDHLAPSSMDQILKLYSDADIPANPNDLACPISVKSTMTQGSRPSTSRTHRNTLYLVHFNFSGPFPVPSYGNSLYYTTLIHDATRGVWVRFMKQKSETGKILQNFVPEMEHHHHRTMKAFRTDIGGEYVSKDVKGFFESWGIIHVFTPPYSPQ